MVVILMIPVLDRMAHRWCEDFNQNYDDDDDAGDGDEDDAVDDNGDDDDGDAEPMASRWGGVDQNIDDQNDDDDDGNDGDHNNNREISANANTRVGHQTNGQRLLFFLSFLAWEYCGPEGQTRYGVRCLSECAQNGKKYW